MVFIYNLQDIFHVFISLKFLIPLNSYHIGVQNYVIIIYLPGL